MAVEIVIDGRDQASPALRAASNSLKQLGSSAQAASSSLSGVAKQALGFAGGLLGVQLIGNAFGMAKEAIVGYNAKMEQTKIAWTTMLRSGAAANKMLEDLTKFAATTPFEFPELESASKRLLSFGFAAKEIIPIMTNVGDASAALGTGAEGIQRMIRGLGQMKAKGRVMGEEMMQFMELGLPAWQMLSDATGKSIASIQQDVTKGKVSFETFKDAFDKYVKTNYGGMMEKQSQTFEGAMSTIKDTLRMGAAGMFEPLFKRISELTLAFANFIQSGQFLEISERIKTTITNIIQAFDSLAPSIKQGAILFGAILAVGSGLAMFLPMIAGAFGVLISPLGAVVAAAALLAAAWSTNFLGIRDIVAAVIPKLREWLVETIGRIIVWWQTNWPKIKQVVENVLNAITSFWKQNGSNIMNIVKTIFEFVERVVGRAMNVVGDVINIALSVLRGDWRSAWGSFKNILSNVIDQVEDIIQSLGNILGDLVITIGRTLGLSEEDIQAWSEGIKEFLGNTIGFFVGLYNGVTSIIGDLVGWIIDQVAKLIDWWNENLPAIGGAARAVLIFLGDVWAAIVKNVQKFVETVQKTWDDHGKNILGIIRSLWTFITNMIGNAIGAIGDIISIALNLIQGNWAGVWEGVGRLVGRVWSSIIDVISTSINVILDAIGILLRALGREDIVSGWKSTVTSMAESAKVLGATVAEAAEATDMMGASSVSTADKLKSQIASALEMIDTQVQQTEVYVDGKAVAEEYFSAVGAGLEKLTGGAETAEEKFRKSEAAFLATAEAEKALDEQSRRAAGGLEETAKAGEKASEATRTLGPSIQQVTSAIIRLHPATLAANVQVQTWSRRIADVNVALVANQDQVRAAQAEYGRMSEQLGTLNNQLSLAKQRLSDLTSPKLSGSTELGMQINAIEAQLKRLGLAEMMIPEITKIPSASELSQQLQISIEDAERLFATLSQAAQARWMSDLQLALTEVTRQYPLLTAGAESYLSTLPTTKEELQKILEALRLTQSLRFDEQLRLIGEAAAGAQKEMTFDEAIAGIGQAQSQISSLTLAISQQEAVMRSQQAVIDSIQAASSALNETLARYQEELKRAEQNQRLVTEALQMAYQWLLQDREKFTELGAEGERVAAVMDIKTRELLTAVTDAASDTTGQSSEALASMVENYQTDMGKAMLEVAGLMTEFKGVSDKIKLNIDDVGALKAALEDIPNIDRYVTIHINQVGSASVAIPTSGASVGGGDALYNEWVASGGSGTSEGYAQHISNLQAIGAYQQGGSFVVGGAGGIDQNLVSMLLTKGERVDITPVGGRRSGTVVYITLTGNTLLGKDTSVAKELAYILQPELARIEEMGW